MSSFTRIFIGDIDIFLSYDLSPIIESDSQIDILEGHWDHASSHVEHRLHRCESTLEVTITDIDECREEDIAHLVGSDDTLFSVKTILEQLSNDLRIARECCDSSSHISRGEDPILVTDESSSTTVVRDGYDGRDIEL